MFSNCFNSNLSANRVYSIQPRSKLFCHEERGKKKKNKRNKKLFTANNDGQQSLSFAGVAEVEKRWKNFRICFNPVGRETQLTVRQFGEVSDLGSGEKIGSRKEDERSKPGVQFSPRVPITIHIALPSRIKLLPLPDFHIFTRKRARIHDPNGE